jgi:hypothetical protein
MKKLLLLLPLVLMIGCGNDGVPSTSLTKDGNPAIPQPVNMKYIGPAKVDDAKDVINGCRVYVFKVEDYYHTAVLCVDTNGQKQIVSSVSHQQQKKKNDAKVDTVSDVLQTIVSALGDDE